MKNSTNRWFALLAILLLTANIVTLALLWTTHKRGGDMAAPPPPPANGGGPVFEFINHELQLDSTQQLAYKKLRDEHQAGQRPIQDSLRSARDAFFALLRQDKVSDSTIKVAAEKIGQDEEQLNLFTFHHFQQLRSICTEEQQKKFDGIIDDVLRRMAMPRPQGPPGGKKGDHPDGPEGENLPPAPGGGPGSNGPPPPAPGQ